MTEVLPVNKTRAIMEYASKKENHQGFIVPVKLVLKKKKLKPKPKPKPVDSTNVENLLRDTKYPTEALLQPREEKKEEEEKKPEDVKPLLTKTTNQAETLLELLAKWEDEEKLEEKDDEEVNQDAVKILLEQTIDPANELLKEKNLLTDTKEPASDLLDKIAKNKDKEEEKEEEEDKDKDKEKPVDLNPVEHLLEKTKKPANTLLEGIAENKKEEEKEEESRVQSIQPLLEKSIVNASDIFKNQPEKLDQKDQKDQSSVQSVVPLLKQTIDPAKTLLDTSNIPENKQKLEYTTPDVKSLLSGATNHATTLITHENIKPLPQQPTKQDLSVELKEKGFFAIKASYLNRESIGNIINDYSIRNNSIHYNITYNCYTTTDGKTLNETNFEDISKLIVDEKDLNKIKNTHVVVANRNISKEEIEQKLKEKTSLGETLPEGYQDVVFTRSSSVKDKTSGEMKVIPGEVKSYTLKEDGEVLKT